MKKNQSLDYDLFLLELDDILFNKRDYLVQVYYLFATFYEFTEGTTKAYELAQFMTKILEIHGEKQVFETTKVMFEIDSKYEENFNRLLANAELPLKLELTMQARSFLTLLKTHHKKISILTKGNPIEQLNKLKYLDWEDQEHLKKQISIYFIDELQFRGLEPLAYIADKTGTDITKITFIDKFE